MFGSLVPWKRERSVFPTFDPFSQIMGRMGDEMERLWGEDGGWLTKETTFLPRVDVVETESQFEVQVDLPGLKPEEVNVEWNDGRLWISGKHEEEKEEKGKTYHRIERQHGEFRRVLPLPVNVKEDGIEAGFENGTLRITIPKSEEAKTKHIEVKS